MLNFVSKVSKRKQSHISVKELLSQSLVENHIHARICARSKLEKRIPQSVTHSQHRTALLTRERRDNHLWEDFTVQMEVFALITTGVGLC